MHAAFPSRNVRPFNQALSCLLRFSDRLNVQCMRDPENDSLKLRLSSINSSQSGFCAFEFYDYFFEVLRTDLEQRVDCETGIRPILSVLRSGNNKALDRCELSITDREEESRVAIRLHSKGGIVKTHKLTYAAVPGLWPNTPPQTPCRLSIGSKVVHDFLNHFGTKTGGEVTFWCGPTFFVVRSRADDTLDKNQFRRAISTQVRVQLHAFEAYVVDKEVCLTFPLKEFKAAIAASEHLGVNLELNFGEGGDPLHIRCQLEALHADFVLATTPGEVPPDAANVIAQARREAPQNGGPKDPVPNTEASSRPLVSHQQRSASQRPDIQHGELQPAESVIGPVGPSRMLESTPRLGVALARHNTDIPLFRASQASEANALQEARRSDDEDERDEEDLAALEEIEQSVQRGEIQIRSSQAPSVHHGAAHPGSHSQSTSHHVDQGRAGVPTQQSPSPSTESPPSAKLYVSSDVSTSNRTNPTSSAAKFDAPRGGNGAHSVASTQLRHSTDDPASRSEIDSRHLFDARTAEVALPAVPLGYAASQPSAPARDAGTHFRGTTYKRAATMGVRRSPPKSWKDAIETASQMVVDEEDEDEQAEAEAARQRALAGSYARPFDEDELGASDEEHEASSEPKVSDVSKAQTGCFSSLIGRSPSSVQALVLEFSLVTYGLFVKTSRVGCHTTTPGLLNTVPPFVQLSKMV